MSVYEAGDEITPGEVHTFIPVNQDVHVDHIDKKKDVMTRQQRFSSTMVRSKVDWTVQRTEEVLKEQKRKINLDKP